MDALDFVARCEEADLYVFVLGSLAHRRGADVFTQQWVAANCHWKPKPVAAAFVRLLVWQLFEQVRRYEYRLSRVGHQMSLDIFNLTLPTGESTHLLPPALRELTRPTGESRVIVQATANPATLPTGESLLATTDQNAAAMLTPSARDTEKLTLPTGESTPPINNKNLLNDSLFNNLAISEKDLKAKLLAVFQLGVVSPHLRGNLAKNLMTSEEGGEYWLRVALGLIAQYRSAHPQPIDGSKDYIGANVYPSLRDGAVCLDEFMPPANLNFQQLLFWAAKGGKTAEEIQAEADAEAAHLKALEDEARDHELVRLQNIQDKLKAAEARLEADRFANAQAPLANALPFDQDVEKIWLAALGQLQLEINKSVYDTWVRDTTLAFGDINAPYHESFCIIVPHYYARDWLQNRLHGTIRRILGNVVGRSNITLTFHVATNQ